MTADIGSLMDTRRVRGDRQERVCRHERCMNNIIGQRVEKPRPLLSTAATGPSGHLPTRFTDIKAQQWAISDAMDDAWPVWNSHGEFFNTPPIPTNEEESVFRYLDAATS